MVKYSGCGKQYEYHYVSRYRSHIKSSALLFGTAIDAGCNFMLENFANRNDPSFIQAAILIFQKSWEQQTDRDSNTTIDLPKNPNIKYFKSDFDIELLKPDELELFGGREKIQAFRSGIDDKLKQTDWSSIDKDNRAEYNYMNWLSLAHKGVLMLRAYKANILPQFTEILALQRPIELENANGDKVNGILEFVGTLLDGRTCLADNKSASSPYEEDSVEKSQQLALYQTILNIQAANGGEWTKKIDCAAYAVMGKRMKKIDFKKCTKCGHIGLGSHKTCDNKIDDVRCNGAWDIKTYFEAPTQFVVGNISEDYGNSVLENAATIISCVEKGIFPKNFSKCYDDFGGVCPYIKLCHKNDESSVFKLENKNG